MSSLIDLFPHPSHSLAGHITHHVLAVWSLGANRSVLEAAYKHEAALQHPVIEPPGVVTANNYHEHLGDDNYFSAYVEFFRGQLEQKGTSAVLDEFVFSPSANGEHAKPSKAISRFTDNLVHPMIHIGYGLEFGIPGLVVEGLALAATLKGDRVEPLFPSSLFAHRNLSQTVIPKLQNLVLDDLKAPSHGASNPHLHAFNILNRVIKNHSFDGTLDPQTFFDDTVNAHWKVLSDYAQEWAHDISDRETALVKVEELHWTVGLLYAVNGVNKAAKDSPIHADFFLMHLVTSSLFLPSYIPNLSPASQKVLLQAYMTVVLAWWASRGRQALDIAQFYASTTATPALPSFTTKHPSWALTQSSENPWFAVAQHAIFHPDDHLCKIQRALAHYAAVYGTRHARAELLDGTLFIRAAGLTAERTSQASDEGKSFVWDVSWVQQPEQESHL
ncbi:hypothetical protein BDZ89DRAFT_1057888 [Hymenopellis radicata]|nr:hypothetical protein BDZ89DRAFT_1057888 [Hymenopellis radicata]